jgi:DNA-binding NarL/FixJ family response regulator
MIRILLADDNEMFRTELRRLLIQQEGWTICTEVEDGIQAVSKALQFEPDVIILDISMPGMSGLMAARLVRELLPAAKVILLSTHDQSLMRHILDLSGAHAYISKTESTHELVSTIEILLADGEMGSVAPCPDAEVPCS